MGRLVVGWALIAVGGYFVVAALIDLANGGGGGGEPAVIILVAFGAIMYGGYRLVRRGRSGDPFRERPDPNQPPRPDLP